MTKTKLNLINFELKNFEIQIYDRIRFIKYVLYSEEKNNTSFLK
jgi:hypothetical protein